MSVVPTSRAQLAASFGDDGREQVDFAVLTPSEIQAILSRSLTRYEITGIEDFSGVLKIFTGRHKVLSREVYLKVVQMAELPAKGSDLACFMADVRAMAGVSHPSLIAVHDAGVIEPGIAYSIVEKETGEKLAEVLSAQGAFGFHKAAATVLKIAQALAFAHERGLWHKGLSPDFIWMSPNGDLKVGGMCGSTRRYLTPTCQAEGAQESLHRGVMKDAEALGDLWLQILEPKNFTTDPETHGDSLPPLHKTLISQLRSGTCSSLNPVIEALTQWLDEPVLTAPRKRKKSLSKMLRNVRLF